MRLKNLVINVKLLASEYEIDIDMDGEEVNRSRSTLRVPSRSLDLKDQLYEFSKSSRKDGHIEENSQIFDLQELNDSIS